MSLKKGKSFCASLSVAPLRGLWAYWADHNPHSDVLTSRGRIPQTNRHEMQHRSHRHWGAAREPPQDASARQQLLMIYKPVRSGLITAAPVTREEGGTKLMPIMFRVTP